MPDRQKLRENLVRRTIGRLSRGFHSIRADLSTSRYDRPELLRVGSDAFRPDVTAYSGSELHIYAVETEETIVDNSTHERWLAFSTYVDEDDERVLHVVVPAGSRDHVKLWLRQLSIDADVITIAV